MFAINRELRRRIDFGDSAEVTKKSELITVGS